MSRGGERRPTRPRIGLLGGTFDPIHRGHLMMARAAERACGLERIYFAPAAQPWHKRPTEAGYADRYAMVALALAGHPRWRPLDIPPGASGAPSGRRRTYSIDQVGWLRQHRGDEHLHFIVGADAFVTLRIWKQYRELLGGCDFVVLARAGLGLNEVAAVLPPDLVRGRDADGVDLAGGRRLHWLAKFSHRASSSAVRRSAAAPASARMGMVPAAVAAYARRAGLYGYGKQN